MFILCGTNGGLSQRHCAPQHGKLRGAAFLHVNTARLQALHGCGPQLCATLCSFGLKLLLCGCLALCLGLALCGFAGLKLGQLGADFVGVATCERCMGQLCIDCGALCLKIVHELPLFGV